MLTEILQFRWILQYYCLSYQFIYRQNDILDTKRFSHDFQTNPFWSLHTSIWLSRINRKRGDVNSKLSQHRLKEVVSLYWQFYWKMILCSTTQNSKSELFSNFLFTNNSFFWLNILERIRQNLQNFHNLDRLVEYSLVN